MRVKLDYICAHCGGKSLKQTKRKTVIALDEPYSGQWVECLGCGIQGPKAAWDELALRRSVIRTALSLK